MEITNAPASLGEFIAFRENPFNVGITLPSTYPIVAPVTAELWFRDVKQIDQVVPVTVTGQKIEFTFTIAQLRAMVKAKFYILFNGEYVFFAPITATMGGAIPSAREVVVSLEPIGEILVSIYSDKATVGAAQASATEAKQYRDQAKVYRDEAAANSTGAVDAAGTFDASTGIATQAQSDTFPAGTFTPTISSTKPKGYFLDINVAGNTSIVTGSPIAVAKGGRLRSNGVGFPWTYVEPADTGYEIATDLSDRLPERNLFNPAAATTGSLMTSLGAINANAGYARSEKIKIDPGTDYVGEGDDPMQMRYACFFASNGTSVVSGGWDGTTRTSFTSPATAHYVVITIVAGDISNFQLAKSEAPLAKVSYGTKVGDGTIKFESRDIITNDDEQFVSQAQIEAIATAQVLTEKFKTVNLADPSEFTEDALMQSSGVPVSSALWIYTGNIEVTPGETIFLNSNGNTGSRYACFFAANGTTVVSGGWDGVNTLTKVVPSGAAFIKASFPSEYASSVRVGVGSVDPGEIPYGDLYVEEGVHFSASAVSEVTDKKFVTDSEKAAISTISYLDTQFEQLELKGILQKSFTLSSPIYKDIEDFVEVLLQGDEDILIEEDNGSISTGVAGYCSATANSNLLPEFCREENLWTKWVRYMLKRYFPGQKHARFDTAGVFTIGGSYTQVATNNDVNWGHQYPNGGDDFGGPNPTGQIFFDRYYQIITPTSGNVSVTFNLPDSSYKLAWILSYSHLTGTLTFSVAGGNNRLEYLRESDSSWQELNGATLDTSTPDAFDDVTFSASGSTSTKIRRDQHSMPFKVRRKEGFTLSGSIAITATMGGGKRIEHWGIYYTRANNLFIPVCSAKGSHSLASLRAFYPYGIDKRKPNLYIMGCPTINEWRVASVEPTDTPSAYAARFTGHATIMLGKSFIKAVYARIRWIHLNMNMYEASGDMPTYYKTTEGYNNGFDYLNKMIKEMNALKDANLGKMAVVNLLPAYLNYTKALADFNGLTMRQALYIAGGATTESTTMDQTHEGNVGNEQGFRADVNNWNF